MAYVRCPICNEWGFTDPGPLMHRCKPIFYARDLEDFYDTEWTQFYAGSAEEAAEKWMIKHIEGEGSTTVIVRDLAGNLSRFAVSAEYTVSYYAHEEPVSDEDRAKVDADDGESEPTNDAEDRANRGGW